MEFAIVPFQAGHGSKRARLAARQVALPAPEDGEDPVGEGEERSSEAKRARLAEAVPVNSHVDPREDREDGAGAAEQEKDKDNYTVCYTCEEKVPVKLTTSAGGGCKTRICHACRSAEKALREKYFRDGKIKEWKAMPKKDRRLLVTNNKGTSGKKGKVRELKAIESTSVRAGPSFDSDPP